MRTEAAVLWETGVEAVGATNVRGLIVYDDGR